MARRRSLRATEGAGGATQPPLRPSRGVARRAHCRPHETAGGAHQPRPAPRRLRTRLPRRTCVKPELGRLLAQMGMDKSFVRGEGAWLWDENGRRYLDFLAQYGALPFGFNPPRIWEALNAVRERGEPSFVQPSFLNAAG